MRARLRATALMSSSSVLTILTNVIKSKGIALMLGPSGIGLLALYQSLHNLLATLGGIFSGGGAVQVITELRKDQAHRALQRLFFQSLGVLALITAALVLLSALLGQQIAFWVFGDGTQRLGLLWLSLGALLIFTGVFFTSWLNGFRHIETIARVKVYAALCATVAALLIIYLAGPKGVFALVLLLPAATVLLSWPRVRATLNELKARATESTDHDPHALRRVASIGAVMFVNAGLFVLAVLWVRTRIGHQLDQGAIGLHQAAWSMSMVYIEIILAAFAVDYFPRMVARKDDPAALQTGYNQQLSLSLWIIAPALLVIHAIAPWLIQLLYSAEFVPSAELLKTQLLGDVFKVACWLMGYLFIATRRLRTSLLLQVIWVAAFTGFIHGLLPAWGLVASAWGFVVAYASMAVFSAFLLHRALRITTSAANLWLMGLTVALLLLFSAFDRLWPHLALWLQLSVAAAFSLQSARVLLRYWRTPDA